MSTTFTRYSVQGLKENPLVWHIVFDTFWERDIAVPVDCATSEDFGDLLVSLSLCDRTRVVNGSRDAFRTIMGPNARTIAGE